MIELSVGTIASTTGGQLRGADPDTLVTGPVEFDSRKVTPGSIFMALPGARVDGHDFVPAAMDKGAALAIVAREVDAPCIVAEPVPTPTESANATAFEHDADGGGAAVLAAIDKLARYNTDQLVEQGLTVVGVTGSAGKTSTKDLIGTVLSTAGPTVAPPGSFNNEIGLPYTALRANSDTRFLVSEMSARGIGHIRHLTEVTPPQIGVVLNVGSAHMGEFGSRDAIAQAKGELVEALDEGGVAILNADDEHVAAMAQRTSARVVTFSVGGDADYQAREVELDRMARATFTLVHPHGDPVTLRLQVFGAHQVSNALAAAAVAMEVGIDPAQVTTALSEHRALSAHRMDVRERRDGVTVINDAYNANPESMRAGLEALAYTAGEATSWAVVGQMGELGTKATAEHEQLGRTMGELGIDRAVVVGNGVNQQAIAEAAESAGVRTVQVEDIDAAVNYIDLDLAAGDVVLVKASQSEGLWAVAEGLLFGEGEGA
ncbi:MAG TPA: UDP-N-acetylmuramoyl-tripeptide--D-alanyl-D-alanine ligase [Candidatus Corynebacterium gallistercoris]|uniref:UDP-N-acetylmuramoyl-tripeptide--D-alanyl-D-alanine ligase n=1 Tax=Candidatus Corynebacterium gallistercoris TaxID=2838530 RepID=A0A9D1S074_9CORY|nr:UDP-N-acetylmuramoyl-tripeptide--D-alanyl-D-alanine ligase [Candidatus Corynebacterium gallistercoris]